MKKMQELPMRLALRREGAMWNAYVARPGTMDGAILIGSIFMASVENNLERREAFMDMMKDILSDGIERITGEIPEWNDEVPAPESERGGNA